MIDSISVEAQIHKIQAPKALLDLEWYTKPPIRVYVAGPYSSDPPGNTAAALSVAEWVLVRGDVPFVPHLTMFWEFAHHHEYEAWLEYDMHWLRQCEAVLRIPGPSSGSDKEVAEAIRLGMPVFFGLKAYLDARR